MSSEAEETAEVVIVGAGPSGLVSALLLARLGVRSVVVERGAVTDEHPKAHELNARSIEILHDAGISEEELAVEASPMEDGSRILFCRTINEELGRIDLMADPARRRKYEEHLRQALPYLNLSQSEFEKILVARARRSGLIELRFGHRWESSSIEDDAVLSTIAGASRYTIRSRYLLGCDGASSPVRKAAGIEMDGPTALQTFVNAYFKINLRGRVQAPAKLYWILHPDFAGAFIAHHAEKRWVYAVPVQEPWEQPEDFTADVMRERIQGALGFRVPGLEIASLSTWRMTAQVARAYRKGRVFLVGDAAHRFPPTGGLGMNTGIADAHNLCWKLAQVLSGRAGDALLDTYESERRPVAQKNCAESRLNFDKIFEVIAAFGIDPKGMEHFLRWMARPPFRMLPATWKGALRRLLTWPVYWRFGQALRPGALRERVGAAIARQVNHFDRLGLDIGYEYTEGALVADGPARRSLENDVADYVPSTAPGARLPHSWIAGGAGRSSTLDRLSYTRFSLLATAEWGGGPRLADECGAQFVDTTGFPAGLFPADRALLVRPDGHVAWRENISESGSDRMSAATAQALRLQRSPTLNPQGEAR